MPTQTQKEIKEILKQLKKQAINNNQKLNTKKHERFLLDYLHNIGQKIMYFDTAQPWVFYYLVHSLALIGYELTAEEKKNIQVTLGHMQSQGFAGGNGQVSHLACTYAAVLALVQIGTEALTIIDKAKLQNWFTKLKQGGRFEMNIKGEQDLRGSYIVILIVKLLKLNQDILEGVAEDILSCQTYEGGISNLPGGEAHGGFTFCGVAGLALLNRLQDLDLSKLMYWLSSRQVQFGGFNGRTNKLIDSCYSFWIGSTFNIIDQYLKNNKLDQQQHLLYSQKDLQKYILLYCQNQNGGLVDKPGKTRDIYHTCYSLSGLSLSQKYDIHLNDINLPEIDSVHNVTVKQLQKVKKQYNCSK